jgi:hypothetical protein
LWGHPLLKGHPVSTENPDSMGSKGTAGSRDNLVSPADFAKKGFGAQWGHRVSRAYRVSRASGKRVYPACRVSRVAMASTAVPARRGIWASRVYRANGVHLALPDRQGPKAREEISVSKASQGPLEIRASMGIRALTGLQEWRAQKEIVDIPALLGPKDPKVSLGLPG